jgi:polyene glycosyltransferase
MIATINGSNKDFEQQNGPILFACTGHAGQINCLLRIAGELSRRRVSGLWFAAADERSTDIDRAINGSPIHAISCGTHDAIEGFFNDPAFYAAFANHRPRTAKSILTVVRRLFDPARLTAEYQQMLAHIDRVQPSLMVIDTGTLGAIDAAMERRVPFVLSVPSALSSFFEGLLPWDYPGSGSGLPRNMSAAQKLANLWYRLKLRSGVLAEFVIFPLINPRKARGASSSNLVGRVGRYIDNATAIFCYSVFGIEYPFPAAPKHLHMLGTMMPDLSIKRDDSNELLQWLDRHPSVIYVGLGTLVRLSTAQLAVLISAFERLGPNHSILWKLSESQQALLPRKELPGNVRIERWLPSQVDVIDHPNVRVFLTHGGGNGFHEGIYCGKPLMVMPFWNDCFDFAARAIECGLGLALDRPPDFTADEVTKKIEQLLRDSRFRERAEHWGMQLRKAGGVNRAADLILSAASTVGIPLPAETVGGVPRLAEPSLKPISRFRSS